MLAEILVPMTVFACIFGVLFVYFTTRNKERMLMIEKGADPSTFHRSYKRFGIKIGLMAVGVALGVMTGQFISHTTKMDIEPATMSMIFLFGGTGLIVEHFLARKES